MMIPLGNEVRAEVISSVLGQLSDGIWENSGRMDKYWKFADVNGTNLDISDEMYDNSYSYYRNPVRNGFYGKSEKEIKDWFANKAKQVVRIWADDYGLRDVWDRNNTDVVTYMGGHGVPKITVADVYECYDFLKGRSGKKYGAAPVEEPVDEPYEVVDDVVEPKVSGGMNPSQQDLEDFFTGASTKVGRKGYVKAYTSCYIETDTGDKWTLDELKDYWSKEKANDWVLGQFDSFEDWFDTSLENFYFKPCYDDDIEACGYVRSSSVGRNSDRFEFKVWDSDMYDDIMDEVDSACESSHGELYNEYFFIEGPWEERYDVVRILDDFGVDYEEL